MSLDLCIFSSNISRDRINIQPAMGSPCLHPLSRGILRLGFPLRQVTDSKSSSSMFIQSIISSENPKALRVFSMNLKLILSKALEKSTRRSMPGRLLAVAEAKMSQVDLVTSAIYLPGRYAFCQLLIILSRIGFSLFVIIPDIIL